MIIVHKNVNECGVQWKATDYRPVALGQFFKEVQFIAEFLLGGQERPRCKLGSKACQLTQEFMVW